MTQSPAGMKFRVFDSGRQLASVSHLIIATPLIGELHGTSGANYN